MRKRFRRRRHIQLAEELEFKGGRMNQDIEKFLNLKNPPGRLTKEQAAWFLGFTPDEITILMASGVLRRPTVKSIFWRRRWKTCGEMKSGTAKRRTRLWNTGVTKTAGKVRAQRQTSVNRAKARLRPNLLTQIIDLVNGASGLFSARAPFQLMLQRSLWTRRCLTVGWIPIR